MPLGLKASEAARFADGAVVVTALKTTERGIGAGTIVEISGRTVRIVTAKHVATFGALTVWFDAEHSAPARVFALMPEHDVAVIEATIDPSVSGQFRAAATGEPSARESVHIWGNGFDSPAFREGTVTETGGALPDGQPADGRFEVACIDCVRGDSGAGVFNQQGELVGVYVEYFTYDSGERVGLVEAPDDAVRAAFAPRNYVFQNNS
jgi:S1-C subfamily serine protease